MADPILTVGPSPHIKKGVGLSGHHYLSVLALMPITAMAIGVHGFSALAILLMALASGVFFEVVAQHFMKLEKYAFDGHAILMGLLFALLLPPSAPWWLVVVGMAVTILIGKLIFGGVGSYPFHPALVGYLVMLLSWPHYMQPVAGVSLGVSCPMAVTFGGLFLILTGVANWRTPLMFLIGLLAGAWLFHTVYPETVAQPFAYLIQGNVLLAAFFFVTDEPTSPANRIPLMIFGLVAGVLVMLIRVYGLWMEVVPFAIMLANLLTPLLDRITPKPDSLEEA